MVVVVAVMCAVCCVLRVVCCAVCAVFCVWWCGLQAPASKPCDAVMPSPLRVLPPSAEARSTPASVRALPATR